MARLYYPLSYVSLRVTFSFFLIVSMKQQVIAQDVMWGTVPATPGFSHTENAIAHATNGEAAGQAEAARLGILLGTNITVNTIGSQNIISVTGSNNNITATQSGQNAGTVANYGSIGARN